MNRPLALSQFFKKKHNRKAFIVVGALGLLGFLDEMSFGERVIEFSAPRLYGVEIDAAHDLFRVAYRLLTDFRYYHPVLAYLAAGAGAVVLAMLAYRYRSRLLRAASNAYRSPPCVIALLFVILVFLALVADLHILRSQLPIMLEEVFEMNAAVALLLFCLAAAEGPLTSGGEE